MLEASPTGTVVSEAHTTNGELGTWAGQKQKVKTKDKKLLSLPTENFPPNLGFWGEGGGGNHQNQPVFFSFSFFSL